MSQIVLHNCKTSLQALSIIMGQRTFCTLWTGLRFFFCRIGQGHSRGMRTGQLCSLRTH